MVMKSDLVDKQGNGPLTSTERRIVRIKQELKRNRKMDPQYRENLTTELRILTNGARALRGKKPRGEKQK
jgi:hypothetical protein